MRLLPDTYRRHTHHSDLILGPAKGGQGRPRVGHFGSFWGHFGAQDLTKPTIVPYNAQMEAFTASFCAMLAVFYPVLRSFRSRKAPVYRKGRGFGGRENGQHPLFGTPYGPLPALITPMPKRSTPPPFGGAQNGYMPKRSTPLFGGPQNGSMSKRSTPPYFGGPKK